MCHITTQHQSLLREVGYGVQAATFLCNCKSSKILSSSHKILCCGQTLFYHFLRLDNF